MALHRHALANGGLGAVHGLAGVIGGVTPAAHGAICGVLLGPVLAMNRLHAEGEAATRIATVCGLIAAELSVPEAEAPAALANWARMAGLPGLVAQGLDPAQHHEVAAAAMQSSSYKGNPVALTVSDLEQVLAAAG